MCQADHNILWSRLARPLYVVVSARRRPPKGGPLFANALLASLALRASVAMRRRQVVGVTAVGSFQFSREILGAADFGGEGMRTLDKFVVVEFSEEVCGVRRERLAMRKIDQEADVSRKCIAAARLSLVVEQACQDLASCPSVAGGAGLKDHNGTIHQFSFSLNTGKVSDRCHL
jgi:hypothetical protein